MEFRHILRLFRKNKKFTQDEFGKIFNVSGSTVSSWETGNSRPDLDLAMQIASFFDITVDTLLGSSQQEDLSFALPILIMNTVLTSDSDVVLKEAEHKEYISRNWIEGNPKDYFLYNIVDDSMFNEGIYAGDVALIEKRSTYSNGQICLIGLKEPSQVTLQRLFEFDINHYDVVPSNTRLARFKIRKRDLSIFGVLRRIIRKVN